MGKETLDALLALIEIIQPGGVTCGGGEPTTHPHFEDFLDRLIRHSQRHDYHLGIVTNGKHRDRALLIAQSAYKGDLYAALSQDNYHEKIDPGVIEAFNPQTHPDANVRYVQVTYDQVTPHGRAEDWGPNYFSVCCGGPFVTPGGTIYACACRNFCFGTVHQYHIPRLWLAEGQSCGRHFRQKHRIQEFFPKTSNQLQFELAEGWNSGWISHPSPRIQAKPATSPINMISVSPAQAHGSANN